MRESIPRFDVLPSIAWFVACETYPHFLWSRTRIHPIPCIWQARRFSSLIFEGKFLIFQGWESPFVRYIIFFFFFFLRAKVYWTVKTAVIDEQCDGKFVFWVCACIKGCSRFFFLSIKLWLFLSELSSRTNECFRIIIFSDGLKINLNILLKWNWKENCT